VQREWTCEPKKRVRSKVTPRNLGVGLNVRGGCQSKETGFDAKLEGGPY